MLDSGVVLVAGRTSRKPQTSSDAVLACTGGYQFRVHISAWPHPFFATGVCTIKVRWDGTRGYFWGRRDAAEIAGALAARLERVRVTLCHLQQNAPHWRMMNCGKI
eukprot:scaffold8774_cov158-Isochrysis_galbana.AAC.4